MPSTRRGAGSADSRTETRPADLCPPARDEYDRIERWGDDLALNESDRPAIKEA
jgi:hypothetical protein